VRIVPCQALLEKLYGKAVRGAGIPKRSIHYVDLQLKRELATLWMETIYAENYSGGKSSD